MRTITAILLVTTLASANATSLRLQKRAVEVTSATAYLALLEITGLEKAFIEKTSTKYECPQALSLVQSLESMVEKNTIEMTALRTKCNATQESLEEELQAAFTKFIKKKELATMGKTTAGKKATEEEKTASPNAVFNAAVQEYDQNFKTIKDSAQKLIDGAQVELDKANLDQSAEKEKFDLAVKDFEGIKARIKSTKEESAKVTQASIDGINARLEENRKRVEDDLVVEKKSAEEAHIASSSVCSSTYSDHMILVNNDEQTLNEIKPLLANLALCPSAGTAASFLEVQAAARLETNCALNRNQVHTQAKSNFLQIKSDKLNQIDDATSGSIREWQKRVDDEKTKAEANKAACNTEANDLLSDDISKSEAQAADFKKTYVSHAVEEINSTKELLVDTMNKLKLEWIMEETEHQKKAHEKKSKDMEVTNASNNMKSAKDTMETQIMEATLVQNIGVENAKSIKEIMIKESIVRVDMLKEIEEKKYKAMIKNSLMECKAGVLLLDDEKANVQTIISKLNTLHILQPDDEVHILQPDDEVVEKDGVAGVGVKDLKASIVNPDMEIPVAIEAGAEAGAESKPVETSAAVGGI